MADKPVFICYDQEDRKWLDGLLLHLKALVLQDDIALYGDSYFSAGGDAWEPHISDYLEAAKVAVLLVSPAFLASELVRYDQVPTLLKAEKKGLVIIPIIVRPCLFEEAKFGGISLGRLQAANPPGQELNGLSENEQDQILLSVAKTILRIVRSEP